MKHLVKKVFGKVKDAPRCVSQVCSILCRAFFFATDPNDRPKAGRSSAAQCSRMRRLRCRWHHEQLSVRMAVTAAGRHRDRTKIAVDAAVQVGGCVEQNVDVPVSQGVEQIVADPHRNSRQTPSWTRLSMCQCAGSRKELRSRLWSSQCWQSRRNSQR